MATRYKWFLGLSGLLILLLAVALLLTQPLLNSAAVRLKLQGLVSEQTGGRINYGQIKLVYLPRLALQIERLEFDLPGVLTLKLNRLQASPDLSELFTGDIAIDYLLIDEPKVQLTLPLPESSTESTTHDSEEVWQTVQPLPQLLAEYAPYAKINLNGGDFDLVRNDIAILTARDFNTTLTLDATPDALDIEISGRLPELTLLIEAARPRIEISKLAATVSLQPQKMTLALKKLQLAQPELDLAGELSLSTTTPKLTLQLKSNIPDLAAVRTFMRPLQRQIPGSEILLKRILGGSLTDISVRTEGSTLAELFDLGTLKLGARLDNGEFFLPRLLAHHVTNVSGNLKVANRRIELSDAHLKSGNSTATIGQAAIYRQNKSVPFLIDINNTRLRFDLAELYRNLARQPALSNTLKEVSSVSGQFDFNIQELHGPLADIEEWKFKATGSIADAVVSTRRFPAPITVQSGSYAADDRSITLKSILLQGLDADLKLSGKVKGKAPVPAQIEASVTGRIGKDITRWFRATAGLPETYALATPITIKQAALTWKSDNNLTAKGAFKVANGPTITGDIAFAPSKKLQVTFSLADRMSEARASFNSADNYLKITFSGHLQKETINNVFVEEQLSSGRLDGDFALELVRNNGTKVTTSGKLQGENLLLPIGTSEPLMVSALSVLGQGQTLDIEQFALGLGEISADINGSVTSSEGNYILDLYLHSSLIDLLELNAQIDTLRQKPVESETAVDQDPAGDEDKPRQPLPLLGRVNLEIETLSLKHLTITPLRANIQFEPQKITAQVVEARLCGIDLLPTAQLVPGELELTLPINALDQDMGEGSLCLTGERSKLTGRYDLNGMFTTRGTLNELINAAKGEFTLIARDGAIEQSPLIANLLSVVNLTEFYRGDYLTLDKSKLGYKTLRVEGELAQGRLNLPLLAFDGTTLEIAGQGDINLVPPELDIELLIAPLKTVDTIIKWLPGINYLLAGNLLTIPVRLSGPVEDIDIKVIPVGSVSKGVLGIAERILKLPVKLIEPLSGGEPEEESNTGRNHEIP